jgi:formiminotetrahydrofolate cyclodeaminase
MIDPDYLGLRLSEFLDAVAAPEPAPGGGAVAAVAVALAAGLAAMSARLSARQLPDAATLAAAADALRADAAPLAERDVAAYADVLTARRLPKERPERADVLHGALSAASAVPVRVAEIGVEVMRLAARLEQDGNPALRGDAGTAKLLAAAGVQAAAALVALNLTGGDDPLVQRAGKLAAAARAELG